LRAADKDGGVGTVQAVIAVTRPGPTTTGFVFALYRDVLRRLPDEGGFAFWVGALRAGRVSRAQVATLFLCSPERQGVVVEQFYRQLLRRPSDTAGKAFWVGRLLSGFTEAQVAASFVASGEFTQHFADNAAYVNALYVRLLGRPGGASLPEVAAQTAVLNAGRLTRVQMALAFLASDEAFVKAIDDSFAFYLGHPPDAASRQALLGTLRRGLAVPASLPVNLLASEEYFRRAGGTF